MSDSYASSEQVLRATLESLEYLRISPNRLSNIDHVRSVGGGFGVVRRATLDAGGAATIVAIKELMPAGATKERLRQAIHLARELKVWAGLLHPNILRLVGFYLSEDMTIAQLISPFEEYGHIGNYLGQNNPSEAERLQLAIDTLEGLRYLHDRVRPICHGDLKSRNVLVGRDRRAILCDFGLAIVSEATGGLTTSSFHGTMRYMSPELVNGDTATRTIYSDMWAWGCLLLEIIADIIPYASVNDRTGPLVLLLVNGTLPASLGSDGLQVAEQIRSLLRICWSMPPESRPSVSECLNLLTVYFTVVTGATPLTRELSEDAQTIKEPSAPQILVQECKPLSEETRDTIPLLQPIHWVTKGEITRPSSAGLSQPRPPLPISISSPPALTAAQKLFAGIGHLPQGSPSLTTPVSGSAVTPGTTLTTLPPLRHAISAQSLLQISDPFPGMGCFRIERLNEPSASTNPAQAHAGPSISLFTTTGARRRHNDIDREAMERERALEAVEELREAQNQAYDTQYLINKEKDRKPRTARSAPVRRRSVSLDSDYIFLDKTPQSRTQPPTPAAGPAGGPSNAAYSARQHQSSTKNVTVVHQTLPNQISGATGVPFPVASLGRSSATPPPPSAISSRSAPGAHPSTSSMPRTFPPQPLSPHTLQRARSPPAKL